MKIAMIGHKYVPSREGGVEIVVDELSTRLAKLGHEVTLFNRKRKEYKQIDSYNGCKVLNIFTVNKKSLDAIIYAFIATLKVKKMIKKDEIDVAHFHCEGPCFFLNLLPKKKRRKNCKIVVTIHGLDWQRGKWGGLASKIIKKGETKAVKYADEIIVLSKNNQKYFLETYNRNTNYIPNGIEAPIPLEANIITKKYGLTKNSYVLFLARIVPEKGLHYLIDAWQSTDESQRHGKKLVIAGGSSHTDEYCSSIHEKTKNDKSIIATGFVQGDELKELFSNSYLYVLPSDIEGMPMSLLEAISYGNTCLVSDIPENTEVIDESCFTFKKSNIQSLKEQLVKILQLGDSKNKNTSKTVTWDEVTHRTIELYEKR